ncbi:MAG: MBL fold metallo-hydrolase [Euryarchaeota archaeon]|nr:MBL fold metallo-hydrolase [Euryarchaeota archaeon]
MRILLKRVLMLILVASILSIVLFSFKERVQKDRVSHNIATDKDRIVIVYDNKAVGNLKASWGFSAFIKFKNYTILFDTGGSGEILLWNMRALGIDPGSIDYVFISHIHGDHTGGLWMLLGKNNNVTVIIPNCFPESFKQKVVSYNARVVEVSVFTEILPGIYSTGVLYPVGEQSLVLDTDKGLVIITGCSHPGIVRIVKKAISALNRPVYMVIGGFHLISNSSREIHEIAKELKDLGVKKVIPCHCSGDLARSIFKEIFGLDYEECHVGLIIKI